MVFNMLERTGRITIQEGAIDGARFTFIVGTGFALLWVSILVAVVSLILLVRRASEWRVSVPAGFLLVAIVGMFGEAMIPRPWPVWAPSLPLCGFIIASTLAGWWHPREFR